MKDYIMEFIGAFFLMLAVCLTGNPLAIGLMLCAMVYVGGHVSGGHYNPAVTLAVWIRKKISGKKALAYSASQILGTLVAAALVFWKNGSAFVLTPASAVMPLTAILFEILGTFVLCSVVLAVATTKHFEGNYIYAIGIGFALTAIAFTFGPISGGAFNPAVALGPMLMDAIVGGSSIAYLYVYLIGPLLGAVAAGFLYRYINPKG